MDGVGPLDAATAVGLGLTGPLLRSTGVAYDVRRDFPYLAYDDVEFDVIIGTSGDCWDRFAIRVNEIRESVRIVRQVAEAMPAGDYRSQDKKFTPPPRNRINESMEALIHHFKLFTEGFRVAPGDAYVPVESPARGAGLLHRFGRDVPALPAPRPCPVVRQLAGAGPDGPGRFHPRRHSRHLEHRPRPGGRGPLNGARARSPGHVRGRGCLASPGGLM